MLTIILLLTLMIALYHRASLKITSLILAGILVLWSLYDGIPYVHWAIFLIIFVPLNLSPIRRKVSAKLLDVFKGIMPRISDTEQEALDAGTVWWEAEMFGGKPNWKRFHSFEKAKLTKDEQEFLDGPVEELCSMINDWQITHIDRDLPPEVWDYIKNNGFFSFIIPKEYGGLGFSSYAQSQVLTKINSLSATAGSIVSVPNSLGPAELLMHYGTQEQRDYYLPRLAKGQEVPCFALTAPEAGSDAGGIPDKGIICKGQWNGEEVVGMKLTWDKRYITLAPVASLLGLAFKLYDPEGLLGDKEDLGITCALIPTDTDGVEIGRRHYPMSTPFQNGPTTGKDVFVPLDYIIGGPKNAGLGWRMLVDCLSAGRAISLPSSATGGSKTIAYTTGAYARIRRQFNVPVGYMEGVMEALARIAGKTYLIDAVRTFTAAGIDSGEKPSVASAIVKCHTTDMARDIACDGVDIHGGKAVMMGPKNYAARAYQGAPISITVEGANILTRSLIIYGQGSIRCHPYVLKEIQATQNENRKEAVKDFDKALFGHLGFAMSNKIRTFWLGLSASLLVKKPQSDFTGRYYQRITRFSSALAFLSDVTMGVLGGELKRREMISGRLGDMLSNLYIASSVLKFYHDKGRPEHDKEIVQWSLEHCLYETQMAADGVLKNFPIGWLGKALRLIVFPLGLPLSPPSDKLQRKLARQLQEPGAMREELTHGAYKSESEYSNLWKVDKALRLQLEMEPIVKKFSKALGKRAGNHQVVPFAKEALDAGHITQDEYQLVLDAEEARLEIINVDDFSPEEMKHHDSEA
ncbi:acyl-CoA dehydrogenase [Kangiella spongicola]|uniref:Acyl-coenzyme A dehydrogenase n=1 Tax=Kangiella spongicola TaxID=796379 RepID=A0A318D770_9GAMM|nr:acyl-CoA dehydrogenase [Kangiella spongicola]PXF62707.1 acyl-CoA dehydrogenase [Kangiella spongicola]